MQEILDRAEEAYAGDDLPLARAGYRQVLDASPGNPIALRALAEIERLFAERFAAEMTVSLAVSLHELVDTSVSPRESLVISRLAAGPMSVRRLAELSRIDGGDLHELLFRYVEEGLLAVRKS